MNTIPITINNNTVDVNPYGLTFNSHMQEFAEKASNLSGLAMLYFNDKKTIEAEDYLASRTIQYSAIILSVISGLSVFGAAVLIGYQIPFGLALFVVSLMLAGAFIFLAAASSDVLECKDRLPNISARLTSAVLNNITILQNDYSNIKDRINKRIQKLDAIIEDTNSGLASEYLSKKDKYSNLLLALDFTRKYALEKGLIVEA